MDRVVALTRLPRMLGLHWQFFKTGGPYRPNDSMVGPVGIDPPRPIWSLINIDPGFDIDKVFTNVSAGVQIGLQAILSSMILGTWTAFETLAGDLWETAINVHPADLAALRNNEGRISQKAAAETSQDDAAKGKESKSVRLSSIDEITKGKFDLENRWGTIHRKSRRFNLQTLGGIRAASQRGIC